MSLPSHHESMVLLKRVRFSATSEVIRCGEYLCLCVVLCNFLYRIIVELNVVEVAHA